MKSSVNDIPDSVWDAAGMAASDLGMTPQEWLLQVLMSASRSPTIQSDAGTVPPTWLEQVASEEHLVPITEIAPDQEKSAENLASVKDELEQIRQLVQDYIGVMEPAMRPMLALPEQMQELAELAQDVRQSADAAEKAANSVRPLERTLYRLAAAGDAEETGEHHGPRAAGIGRLFRS